MNDQWSADDFNSNIHPLLPFAAESGAVDGVVLFFFQLFIAQLEVLERLDVVELFQVLVEVFYHVGHQRLDVLLQRQNQ